MHAFAALVTVCQALWMFNRTLCCRLKFIYVRQSIAPLGLLAAHTGAGTAYKRTDTRMRYRADGFDNQLMDSITS
jgi:hypothetical protein